MEATESLLCHSLAQLSKNMKSIVCQSNQEVLTDSSTVNRPSSRPTADISI